MPKFLQSLKRRQFLAGASAAALGLCLPSEAKAVPSSCMATLIDVDRCTGCGKCVDACRERAFTIVPKPSWENVEKRKDGLYPRDWSRKNRNFIRDRLTPYTWLFIQRIPLRTENGLQDVFLPRRCMHCLAPSCMWMCPSGTITYEPTGAVRYYPELCVGDGVCIAECPWHIPMRQGGVAKSLFATQDRSCMFKCDLCFDLQKKGKIPLCVAACPEHVFRFGPYNEIVDEAKKLAKEKNQPDIFGLHENGGTTTLYVSSYSIKDLEVGLLRNQGVQLGQPTLRIREKPLSEKQALHFVGLAPFAGLGLACLRVWRNQQIRKQKVFKK